MREGMPKIAQLASKVSLDGPKWAQLEPLLRTLEALLATWGVPLRIFKHFYAGFREQLCIFSEYSWKSQKNQANWLKSREYCTKTQKKSLNVCKNAPREAKNGRAGVKSKHGWSKMGPLVSTDAEFAGT